jgi:heme-degrading monooxygenase HmoA
MANGEIFRVTLRMEIHPGMGQAFEKAWIDGAGVITDQQANLGQWLSRSSSEPGDIYYIVSDWVDEPRFREYEQSEEHLVHRQKLHPYRAAGSMTTMTVLYDLAGAGARS